MPTRNRNPEPGGRQPSLRGLLVVDAVRGSIRVRSWPVKRPGPRHPTNEYWTKWLKAATFLYRYQPADVQAQLQEATRGTVWMPRDIFIACLRGRAFLPQDEFGRKYYPMALVQEVSQSLDSIAQLEGDLMVRGEDIWQAIHAGTEGQILVMNAAGMPEWGDSAAGGNYHVVRIAGGLVTPNAVTPNSTAYQYRSQMAFSWDYDMFPFDEFRIVMNGGGNQAGQTNTFQLALAASITNPISAAGNDFVVNNVPNDKDSGWIAVSDSLSGLLFLVLAVKGSNGTVACTPRFMEVHLRRT
jgi:hypothetical protein